ncbi:type IV secretion system DNA-binding domain-containing protein (plasmid) [Pseudomonas aeruginosa]|nr:type IV secretion system DNA-binding domain-containing protein [Pseudomonas aeruginosa]
MSKQRPVRQHEELTSDVSRGLSAWISRQLNRAFAVGLLLVTSVSIALAAAFFYVNSSEDETELGIYHRFKVATWAVDYLKWRSLGLTITVGNDEYKVQSGALAADEDVAERVAPIGNAYIRAFAVALFLSVFGFVAAYVALAKKGRGLSQEKLLRGGRLVEPKELQKSVNKVGASDIEIGPIAIPKGTEVQHSLVTGAPGVGKSVLISQILDRVADRGESAIVYDKTGDFVAKYFDPSRGDVILNPLDSRCPAWTPWEELRHPADSLRLAKSLIPDGSGEGAYFHSSAQGILAAGLREMERRGTRDIAELLRLVVTGTHSELEKLIGVSPAAAALREGNEKALASILSTAGTYTEALQWLPASGEAFSIRGFVEEIDGRTGRRPWLFLTSREDFHQTLRPLLGCWIEAAAAAILSLQAKSDRRIWMSLDELPSLGKLSSVQTLLAQGRKYGAAAVLGLQSLAQVREIFGRDGAEALSGLASTRVVFRAPDADSAAWLSRELGERDSEEMKESYRTELEGAGSSTLAAQRETRPLVLPTEIQQLQNLHAYIRLPGDLPISLIQLTPKDRPTVARHFEPASVELTVFAEMERRAAARKAAKVAEEPTEQAEPPAPSQPDAQPVAPTALAVAVTESVSSVPVAPWELDSAPDGTSDADPFADVVPPKKDPFSSGGLL